MSLPSRASAGGRGFLDVQSLARRQGRQTQSLLDLYVLERFLARLVAGPYADQFILKGGMLLAAWDARRATVDGDFLARQLPGDAATVLDRIIEIASTPGPVEDGVDFTTRRVPLVCLRAQSITRRHATEGACDSAPDPARPPGRAQGYGTVSIDPVMFVQTQERVLVDWSRRSISTPAWQRWSAGYSDIT